jgi:hypothetical protein
MVRKYASRTYIFNAYEKKIIDGEVMCCEKRRNRCYTKEEILEDYRRSKNWQMRAELAGILKYIFGEKV